MSLGGRTQIFTLELAKLEEVARKAVDDMSNAERWAVFIECLTDRSMRATINEIDGREEGIAMAGGMLLNISRSEIERVRLESEFKGQIDRQIMEGKLEKAERERERSGKRKGVEQTAPNALAEGASIEFVQKITGFDIQTIKALQSQ